MKCPIDSYIKSININIIATMKKQIDPLLEFVTQQLT